MSLLAVAMQTNKKVDNIHKSSVKFNFNHNLEMLSVKMLLKVHI